MNAANRAPVAGNDGYAIDEDTVLSVGAPGILGNDSDLDGNPLTAILVAGPAHGSVVLNPNGSFSYTPGANFNGSDSFTYKANDGALDSNVATVSIAVSPVNDAPVAGDDAYGVAEGTSLTVAAPGVLTNDTDVDGGALGAVLVAGPAQGTLALNANGSFAYTPAAGSAPGSVSFTYKANDGSLDSNVATVRIAISPAEEPDPEGPCTITGTPQADTLNGTSRNEVICGLGGNDTIDGGRGNDTIRGGAGNDRVQGGDGNDRVDAGEGNDVIDGGDGNDRVEAGDGDDQLSGSEGNDDLDGGAGQDLLDGGVGNDQLFGLGGNDRVLGGPGNDFLRGGAGFNILDGAAGSDNCVNDGGSGEIINCERGRTNAGAPPIAAGTFSAAFTRPNQEASRSISVPAGTPGIGIVLTWGDAAATFGVSVELVNGKQVVARGLAMAGKLRLGKPAKLRLKTRKGAGFMSVEVQTPAKLRLVKKPLKLRLKIRAKKITGRTAVTTRVVRLRPRSR